MSRLLPVLSTVAILAALPGLSLADTVTLRSGNGSVGGQDRAIAMLKGPANGAFGHAFSSTDFTNEHRGCKPAEIHSKTRKQMVAPAGFEPALRDLQSRVLPD